MQKPEIGIDKIASIFCLATKKTLEKGTKLDVTYSKTTQIIPRICLRPDLGCFVQFFGDYNGIAIMNFPEETGFEIYRQYMLTMGLPESDLVKVGSSSEVVDTMGEITNQILGRAMRMAESKLDLVSKFGQPKALYLNNSIILSLETTRDENDSSKEDLHTDCRRLVIKIGSQRFHIELSMEKTGFITV